MLAIIIIFKVTILFVKEKKSQCWFFLYDILSYYWSLTKVVDVQCVYVLNFRISNLISTYKKNDVLS